MRRHLTSRPSRSRFAHLSILIAAAPLFGGCIAQSADESIDAQDEALKPTYGVDYAWARPSISHLKGEGYSFVCRYLSYDTTGKNISASEAHALRADGMGVVLNWEWGATDALDGYARGVEHAKAAEAQAKALGAPNDRPIYFSIDFDASSAQQGAINAYFDGVASVIGRARTGAYGGYFPIKRLFDAGKIKWAWQTYAWSGGLWDKRAQLRQVENGIEGGGLDKDEAVAADFGQWGAPKPVTHGSSGSLGGDVSAEPAVGRNPDGRLEVFAVGAKGALETTFQTAPNSGWSGWFSLGGSLEGRPAVANDEDGRIEVFVRSKAGTMEHAWQDAPNGKIGAFASLGGDLTSDPAVARNQDGRLELFAVGTDGAVHHVWQTAANGGWSGWSSLGIAGGGLTQPTALRAHDGTLRVFAVGKDGRTYYRAQEKSGWGGWTSLGGKATSDVTVGLNQDGRLEAFVRGGDGALWHTWEKSVDGAWSGWASLGGGVHAPSVSNDADGALVVFVRGDGAGELFRISQTKPNSGWGSWEGMGGAVAGGPEASRDKDGRVEVFYRSTDGTVRHVWEGAPETW